MTLNFTHASVAGGSSLLQKIINQKTEIIDFLPLLGFRHFRKKILPPYFFWWKTTFSASPRFLAQVFKKVFRGLLSNGDIQWIKLTKRPLNHTTIFVLGNFSRFRKWQNSSSGSDETKIFFIYKVPFTLHLLVELIHNSTNAKEQKNRTSQCLQKRASKLVSSLPEHKKWEKKVEDFLFLPIYLYNIKRF